MLLILICAQLSRNFAQEKKVFEEEAGAQVAELSVCKRFFGIYFIFNDAVCQPRRALFALTNPSHVENLFGNFFQYLEGCG